MHWSRLPENHQVLRGTNHEASLRSLLTALRLPVVRMIVLFTVHIHGHINQMLHVRLSA